MQSALLACSQVLSQSLEVSSGSFRPVASFKYCCNHGRRHLGGRSRRTATAVAGTLALGA